MTHPLHTSSSYTFPIYHSNPKGTFALLSFHSQVKDLQVTTDHIAVVVSITAQHALESYKHASVLGIFSHETKPLIPIDDFTKKINTTFVFPIKKLTSPQDLIEIGYFTEIKHPSFSTHKSSEPIKVSCQVILNLFMRTVPGYYSKEDSSLMRELVTLKGLNVDDLEDEPICCLMNLEESKDKLEFEAVSKEHQIAWHHLSASCTLKSLL